MQSKRLVIIVLIFVGLTNSLYMFFNATIFRSEYERQNVEQIQELGEVVKNEIEHALGFGIPITFIGGMDPFLSTILRDTPELAYIRVASKTKILFKAERDSTANKDILIPIFSGGVQQGEIQLGMSDKFDNRPLAMFFDLITIVFAGLIITYEIIRFFSMKLVAIPFRQSILTFNTMIKEINPYHNIAMPVEFHGILEHARYHLLIRTNQIQRTGANLNQVSMACIESVFHGRQRLLRAIQKQRARLRDLTTPSADGTQRIVDPSQIRPVVFLFFLGANLHSSFLPIFARDLLENETFLSGLFSQEILMGLPITCHMGTVFLFMLFMGSKFFKERVPMDYAISVGTLCTFSGLIICGMSKDIVQLIAGRILCAIGFSFIVIYGKQFIVEHAPPEKRSLHLAGFTAAFSGGLFCSIIIGSILADYFAYRFVFFSAAAIILFIYLFDHMIMADKSCGIKPADPALEKVGLGKFFHTGATELNLICLFAHGIFTRITFIGFYYFSLPVLLKPDFSYADIGRIMMFYSVPSVLFGGFLNKHIKRIGQSKASVVGSNILVGIILGSFFIPMQGPMWLKALFTIFTLLVLGISNSITFPAQSSLLFETRTAKTLGTTTTLSVYSSFERIGSALGPIFYGFLTSLYGIVPAIVIGGALCIISNILFYIFFHPDKTQGKAAP